VKLKRSEDAVGEAAKLADFEQDYIAEHIEKDLWILDKVRRMDEEGLFDDLPPLMRGLVKRLLGMQKKPLEGRITKEEDG
jgi:hypothetical protein